MFTEPIFSVKDVAYLLDIPKLLVYKLINVGKLKAYLNTKKEGYRITKEDFKEYCIGKEINFDEILEKYYKENGVTIDKEKISPQDNNSILGYPPHPYNPGYKSPNMYYDPKYSPTNKSKFPGENHKGPKDCNEHNALYSTIAIGMKFGIDPLNFYSMLEALGYIYRNNGEEYWNASAPLVRFGLVKLHDPRGLVWTYIGKNFLEDQLIYEIGFDYTNQEKNRQLMRKILGYTH